MRSSPNLRSVPHLPCRAKHWRQLAFWASLGAWLTAEDDQDRARLLVGTGSRCEWGPATCAHFAHGCRGTPKTPPYLRTYPPAHPCCRLLEDALRTLPCQDPMADDTAWRAAKSDPARVEGLRLALAAFQASRELAAPAEAPTDDWEVLLAQARCMRKLGQAPGEWLPLLARACQVAAADGGVLLPLYKLHAARMRLLLAMPSARRWANSNNTARPNSRSSQRFDADPGQERALLRLVGGYCFLPSTANQLASQGDLLEPEAAGSNQAAADQWRELWNGLLGDCCAAMQWVQEKDRGFHRAAHRSVLGAVKTHKNGWLFWGPGFLSWQFSRLLLRAILKVVCAPLAGWRLPCSRSARRLRLPLPSCPSSRKPSMPSSQPCNQSRWGWLTGAASAWSWHRVHAPTALELCHPCIARMANCPHGKCG